MPVPDLRFPAGLARLVARLPAQPASQVFVTLLNLAHHQGSLAGEWDFIGTRRVHISVLDLGLTLRFGHDGKRFVARHEGAPDIRFAASAADFLRITLREEDPDTLFFQRRLVIEGDTELGLQLKNRLDALELPRFLQNLVAR